MRRPCDRLGRGAPTADSASLCPLLQRSENAPLVGQRCAILAPGAADRKHHVTATPRRIASSLHASPSFRYTHGSHWLHQEAIAQRIQMSCGEEFVYRNKNAKLRFR